MQQPSFESSSLFHINIRILLFSEQTMPRYKISDYPAMETAGLVLFLVACVVTCLCVCLQDYRKRNESEHRIGMYMYLSRSWVYIS